jgi:hypothetical protein
MLALPSVVAEFRYGKDRESDAIWQMWQAERTPASITATSSKTASCCLLVAETFQQFGGPGAIRTRDTRFRRAVLYPLSYGAIWSRVPVGS